MTLDQLILYADEHAVQMCDRGDKLDVSGDPSTIERLLPEIKVHKAEIINYLQNNIPTDPLVKPCPLCGGRSFIHGHRGGYFCLSCQPDVRPGKPIRAGGRRNQPVKLTIDNNAILTGYTPELYRELTGKFTLDNPAYLKAVQFGRYCGNIDKTIELWEQKRSSLILPRGAASGILRTAKKHGLVAFVDNRLSLPELDLSFQGALRLYQQQAVTEILQKHFGVLKAGTGSGKTVMALAIIAARRQPTLILVHTKELLFQWRNRIKTFLSVDAGLIGGGRFDVQPV